MLTDPTVVPRTVAEQLPEERVHNEGVKVTDPVPEAEKVTFPVGVGVWPLTVAVQVVDASELIEEVAQLTVVVVAALMYGTPLYSICWMTDLST